MKIVKLTAENVKRLKAVEVSPSGDLVVIGGKNDAGKSSLLDAIEMAMRGEKATPGEPVRRGQKDARVVLDLGDLTVTRTYGAAGGRKLVVANKDGARFPSPQAMLDRLYGALTFDPLAFERQEPKAQAETLRRLVGLDLSVVDGKRARAYEERTEQNRTVRALEVKLETAQRYEDAPGDEVSIAGLVAELAEAERAEKAARKASDRSDQYRRELDNAIELRLSLEAEAEALREEIAHLETRILDAKERAVILETDGQDAALLAADAVAAVPDTAPIRERLQAAEGVNVKVRTNRQWAQANGALADAEAEARRLTDRIAGLDAERLAALAAVSFPVPGLTIGDDGVILDGLPFEQASTSDRIRVSVAIGLASNPELRVLLVRDGSLLGEEKLRLLGEMAAQANAQVWLELLQETPDGRTTVFIEDGAVRPKVKREVCNA